MARPKVRAKLRRLRDRLRVIRQFESHAYWRNRPIRPNVVLYESFSGNGMLCNPEAIFRALLAAPDMGHLHHVWALSNLDKYDVVMRKFSGHPNVTFVRTHSPAYYRTLATAKYLVNNATFPPQFGKRDGQVYVNTWHGTPLKRMGYDQVKGGPDTRNVIRNFVMADYLLSGNEFMTRQMYETAYKLRGIYRGKIIQEGFPRIDRQLASEAENRELRAELRSRGVAIDDEQKIILYAPTWKGDSFYAPEDDAAELRHRVEQLNAGIDTTRYRVLLRVHQQVYRYAVDQPELRDMLVPNDVPANAVLGTTDILVTDYSSIFYDFLATGRPILFFVPDLADYTDSRGFYVAPAEWPGPVTDSVDELAELVNAVGTGGEHDPQVSHAAAYEKHAAEYTPRDDGHCAERVVDVVFRGRTEGYDVRDDFSDGRESILIYLGGMRTNGITTSMLNLLDNIDHTRFDVSAFYSYRRRSADRKKNEALINPNVRLFPYIGGINGSKRYTFGRRKLLAKGLNAPGVNLEAHRALFRDELRRVFGDSRFDYVVDFSGYGPFWSYVLLEMPAKCHAIWMHNDMTSDQMREVNGRRPLEVGLGAVFTAYSRWDRLVSVSPALKEMNEQKLRAVAGSAEFTSALNTINFQRILDLAKEDLLAGPTVEAEGGEAGAEEGVVGGADPEVGQLSPEEHEKRAEAARKEAERHALLERILEDRPGVTTFVTIGRLSPEKNHARLIRAFAQVHADEPNTRLIIISDGPLREQLEALIAELDLGDSVIMAGQQNNPYAILAKADCFVMSSDYEGQPMVILEARVLGIPVVSTEFGSVRGSLPDGVGLVVPRSVEGLSSGMRELLRDNVPNPPFDYREYNRQAIDQFYTAIGAAPGNRADPS